MDNPKNGNRLAIYLHDKLVGYLWLDERQRFIFQYVADILTRHGSSGLSISLPLRQEAYIDDTARPFFANLLPESDVRRIITRKLGISEYNDFMLLKIIGGECAGDVSILPEGMSPQEKPGYRQLSEDELHTIISELPQKPLLAGEKGIRLSLAGAQNKLPVYIKKNKISLTTGNAPSTHIIKPPIKDLDGLVENEAFCMMLAKSMGMNVPIVSIRQNLDTLFIIERFDRTINAKGKVGRLHQEDFCQAQGILPHQKYETEGGPSLAQCFDLLASVSIRPAADRFALLKWTIFNVLVGNADAHAKNLAILLENPGPRLAPFYDLISTDVYDHLAKKLAMKIGGEDRVDWLQPRHWRKFADSASMKQNLVWNTLSDMAGNILPKAEYTAAEISSACGENKIIEKIIAGIKKRVRKLS
jgi:serine/threonine-protein kinase HipA